jgi:putative transposase
MRRTFTDRLYPNQHHGRLLEQQLEACRGRYHHLLAARRDAWEQRQESLRLYDQQATLPALKAERPSLAGVQSPVLQHVAVRSDLAFQAYFRRGTAGAAPGSPRVRGHGRYDSLTVPQVPVGCRLEAEDQRVRRATLGRVTVVVPRPLLEGTPKTATIRRSSTGKWSVCFSSECAHPEPVPATGPHRGLDVGLTTCATLSTGQEMATHRFLRNAASPQPNRARLSVRHGARSWRASRSARAGDEATSRTRTAAASSTRLI